MEFKRNVNAYPIILDFQTEDKEVKYWNLIAYDEEWEGCSREDFAECIDSLNNSLLENQKLKIHCYDLGTMYHFCKELFKDKIHDLIDSSTLTKHDLPCDWVRFFDYDKIKFIETQQLFDDKDPTAIRNKLMDFLNQTYHKSMDERPYSQAGIIKKELKKVLPQDNEWRNLNNRLKLNEETYWLYNNAFAGGEVYAPNGSRDIVLEIQSYDRISAYPYEMVAREFPYVGVMVVKDPKEERIKHITENYLYGVHLELIGINIKKDKIPTIRCDNLVSYDGKLMSDEGRLFKSNKIELVLLKPDYELALRHYDIQEIKIKQIFYHRIKKKLPTVFTDIVLKKFKDKNELPKDTKEYTNAKIAVNTLAGLFQQDPLKYSESLEAHYKKDNFFMPYVIGCWLTAFARESLFKLIDAGGYDSAYWDTDCVKLIGGERYTEVIDGLNKEMEQLPYRLGQWKFEGNFEIKVLKNKIYFTRDETGKEKATVAGVNLEPAIPYIQNDIGSLLNIDYGYTIPKEYSNYYVYYVGDNWRQAIPTEYKFNLIKERN